MLNARDAGGIDERAESSDREATALGKRVDENIERVRLKKFRR